MSEVSDQYYAYAQESKLMLQRCGDCGTYQFPPFERCTTCLSRNLSWVEASGKGTVWGSIRMHQVYYADFKDEIPYTVSLIALEEGPMLMSKVVNAGEGLPECDESVTVSFLRRGEQNLPVFELV